MNFCRILKILPNSFLIFFIITSWSIAAFASQNDSNNSPLDRTKLTTNQRDFLNAYEAIKANDRPLIAHYKKELKHYELYPYIVYLDFKYHFSSTPESEIQHFIERYPNNVLTPFLIRHYLLYLGQTKQFLLYLKYYKLASQDDNDLTCYFYASKIQQNQIPEILEPAALFWRQQLTLPNECDLMDKILHQRNRITGSMLWERINLNMQKGQLNEAKRLSKSLSKQGHQVLEFWIETYQSPDKVVLDMPKYVPATLRKSIFMQGVTRLAYSDPKRALNTLKMRAYQYGLSRSEFQNLAQQISLRFAYQYLPEAQIYLKDLDQAVQDSNVMNWRLQLAIHNSNWVNYLDLFNLLPTDMQQKNRWIYWKARSYEELNEPKLAKPIFQTLAKQRNFYGFMSADKLSQPYRFNPSPSKAFDYQKLVQKYPQLNTIKELIAVDWKKSLRREWYHLLQNIAPDDIEAIANSMASWQQHHLAIQTIAKAKMWDDLDIRFPTPYKQPILNAAKAHTIDPAWVYGVMRRESAFSPTISSDAGATGLMQIMPNTARYMGKKLGFKRQKYTQLTNAVANIQLGSAYLSYLDDKYQGNRILATAAYNAGPNKVDSWIPKGTTLSADQWIDTIPFSETRAYVKAVMEYTTIFKSVLSKHYDRLENFMKPIGTLPIEAKATIGANP